MILISVKSVWFLPTEFLFERAEKYITVYMCNMRVGNTISLRHVLRLWRTIVAIMHSYIVALYLRIISNFYFLNPKSKIWQYMSSTRWFGLQTFIPVPICYNHAHERARCTDHKDRWVLSYRPAGATSGSAWYTFVRGASDRASVCKYIWSFYTFEFLPKWTSYFCVCKRGGWGECCDEWSRVWTG
jgi:hypothetical protein